MLAKFVNSLGASTRHSYINQRLRCHGEAGRRVSLEMNHADFCLLYEQVSRAIMV